MTTKSSQIHTFSIVAHDAQENSWGVAVASKFLAVGATVPYAKAGIGAIATQSAANLSYGEQGLHLMALGLSASETLKELLKSDEEPEERQVGIVDSKGEAATYSGKDCSSWAGGVTGKGYAIQGNILVGAQTIHAMAEAFEQATGELADRLFKALLIGDRTGGDRRGKQSASLLVVKPKGSYGGFNDRYIDLRVDNHPEPVEELGTLLQLHHIFLGSSKEHEKVKIDALLTQELQKLVKRLGYYDGEVDGIWNAATQRAFFTFIDIENLEQRVDVANGLIDPPALNYIRSQFLDQNQPT
jgi:uncharacterized Ntn-hydrolase superfamily protein